MKDTFTGSEDHIVTYTDTHSVMRVRPELNLKPVSGRSGGHIFAISASVRDTRFELEVLSNDRPYYISIMKSHSEHQTQDAGITGSTHLLRSPDVYLA